MATQKNPYNRGNYNLIAEFCLSFKGKPFTKSQVMEHAINELGMPESSAKASVGVVLSPREFNENKKGDCRGNFSAKGHLYFIKRNKRNMIKNEKGEEVKEEQKLQWRWRKKPMAVYKREDQYLTAEQIAERDQRKADAKAEREAKKIAKAEAILKAREERKEKREAKKKAEAEAKAKAKEERKEKREAKKKAEAEAKAKAKKEREEKRKERIAKAEAKKSEDKTEAEMMAEEDALAESLANQAESEMPEIETSISIESETEEVETTSEEVETTSEVVEITSEVVTG